MGVGGIGMSTTVVVIVSAYIGLVIAWAAIWLSIWVDARGWGWPEKERRFAARMFFAAPVWFIPAAALFVPRIAVFCRDLLKDAVTLR